LGQSPKNIDRVEQDREAVRLALVPCRQGLAQEAEGEAGIVQQEKALSGGIGQGRKEVARPRTAELTLRAHVCFPGARSRISGGSPRT
jgi:hypothetical protein